MAIIKSFTSLEQSKKLAKILPLESADICYVCGNTTLVSPTKYGDTSIEELYKKHIIPCWSLAALLGVLPRETRLLKSATDDIYYHCDCPKGNVDKWFDNPVDACYEMILKLNELKML